jgi:transposase
VEVLVAAAGLPVPPPVAAVVDGDLLDDLPPDLPALLQCLPDADLYLPDEVQVAFHPTLTRVWCRNGRRGQRQVEAPGANAKVYGFGMVDWCAGWFDGFLAPGRTAAAFCAQLRTAVVRSRSRGRVAIVLADNLRTHTPAGSKLVRQLLAELQGQLYLVYTPPYDPDANRIEWLWRRTRREVTHNHQRGTFDEVQADLRDHFARLAAQPNAVLRQVGSPFADEPAFQSAAIRPFARAA